MSRRSLVGIEMAIVVAEKQGCDVISATGCRALPEWGRQASTIVLLRQPESSHAAWRVTSHIGTSDEFDQGFYFGNAEDAWKLYVERTERARLDEAIYDQRMAV